MRRLALILIPLLTACAGDPPKNIGVQNGQLTPCPSSPNCVSSYASDELHRIEPLKANIDQIAKIVEQLDDTQIISRDNTYLYAEFTSALLGFVDDVEFLHDSDAAVTHVRSASRLGHSDLGANRERIEALRAGLNEN